MPLSSNRKVFKSVSMENQPVEIAVRGDFAAKEPDLGEYLSDPQVEGILRVANQEAARILEKAQGEAQQLLTEAQSNRDIFVEAARQEGIALGYEEGLAKGGKEAGILKEQAESLLTEARKAYQGVMVQAEPNLLDLAVLIAEKILRQQVVLAPDTVKKVVTELLGEVHAGETFLIHVHPAEARLLQEAQGELKALIPPGAALHIVPDKSITLGGSRLETETGYYDATLEGQLLELKKLLKDGGANAESG